MLIRSQNKKSIANLDISFGFSIAETTKDFLIYAHSTTDRQQVRLGTYATEEKAIKVLDQICERYQASLYCDYAYDIAAQVQRPYILVQNEVFQMPADSEV